MTAYRWEGERLILELYIQPRASTDEIGGMHNGALKVRITAPPVDGQANAHLLRFLARQFGVAKSRIRLLQGQNSRLKRIAIDRPVKLPSHIKPRPPA